MRQEVEYISALEKLGVQVEVITSQRKDASTGIQFTISLEENEVPKDIAGLLEWFTPQDGYSYKVTLHDAELGTYVSGNISGSVYPKNGDQDRIPRSPLDAIREAKEKVKNSIVSSSAQDRAMREEEETSTFLDMSRNAAIFSEELELFHFTIESVEVLCYPASWGFAER
jgi:hypothetical protein